MCNPHGKPDFQLHCLTYNIYPSFIEIPRGEWVGCYISLTCRHEENIQGGFKYTEDSSFMIV